MIAEEKRCKVRCKFITNNHENQLFFVPKKFSFTFTLISSMILF